MFSVLRSAARPPCARTLFRRTFASIVPVEYVPAEPVTLTEPTTKPPHPLEERVPVNPNHGLYGFFRKRDDGGYETTGGSFAKDEAEKGGRNWRIQELRLKSFQDLHTLWYVLIRERSVLDTQMAEMSTLGVYRGLLYFKWRKRDVGISLGYIKFIMNERRLAYLGAVELVEKYKQDRIDRAVHKVMIEDYHETLREHKRFRTKTRRSPKGRRRGAASTSDVAA